jgi:translocation and assembly module TamB
MAISLKMGPEGSDVIGSAYVDRAFIKFPEFVHAFESLQSDIVFNHKKIVINSIKSDFAEGKIQGSGSLELLGKKNYPLNVSGTFDRIKLNIPDKIRSSGSGSFSLSGSHFPFVLKGNYNVREGLFSKELNEGGPQNEDLKRDQFLPKFLVESSFQPLLLDLKVDFSNGVQAKNEIIDGSATGNIHVEGLPTKPKLTGLIRANPETKIKFRENTFDVSSAILTFDDPAEINPRLNINARTRVDGYDVNLQVTGSGKKPEFSVSSVPPMPERDIFSLLALGTTDRKLTDPGIGSQQSSGASQQLISGVANEALKGVTKGLGVDVQLSPGFDDTNEAYQKVVIKKQFNRRLDVSGSRSLGKKSELEAKLRYRFTDRVSGVVSGQVIDQSETSDSSGQQFRSSEKVGLDFEYKFEFK